MWPLFKALIKEEVQRLWRRALRRPEPPPPYTQYRAERRGSPPSAGGGPSAPA